MLSAPLSRLWFFWRGLTRLDRAALGVTLLYGLVWLGRAFKREIPFSRFIGFLFFLSLSYLLFRIAGWTRGRLLWSLRNRLIVAYVLIAVVPILLLIVMAALSTYLLYWQLGAYLLYEDIEKRIERLEATAETLAVSLTAEIAASPRTAALPASTRADLPGLQVELGAGQELLDRQGGPTQDRFAGIVQRGDKLCLRTVVARPTPTGRLLVSASVPVSSELMDSLAPELGPIQMVATRLATEGGPKGLVLPIGNQNFVRVAQITTRLRRLPPRTNFLDYEIGALSRLEAVLADPRPEEASSSPVLVSFSVRPSQLNRRLLRSLGEFAGTAVTTLLVVGIFFLVIEVAALVTGIVLTRTITRAVSDLYGATQYVQAGDLTHRVRIKRNDQLGALGESFNSMTSSISALIEEQRQRQRLENELSIAREVQEQLFPQALPSLPGIQLEAICRPARMVSGDYYDFIRLGPTRLGIALADISGKGISAALLMASLQAALRSQVQLDGRLSENTADVVSRLNRHLYLNTSEDRFATLFYAIYDTSSCTLHYTNAGHLPPLCLIGEKVCKLEEGGMVVGVFDNCTYEQGILQVEPGSLLLAYSDGMTEPENVYGEEFGVKGVLEVALRHRNAVPQVLAQTLMRAAEEWAGAAEQADDMTLIVARLG